MRSPRVFCSYTSRSRGRGIPAAVELRRIVLAVAKQTGWSRGELLAMSLSELVRWIEAMPKDGKSPGLSREECLAMPEELVSWKGGLPSRHGAGRSEYVVVS